MCVYDVYVCMCTLCDVCAHVCDVCVHVHMCV